MGEDNLIQYDIYFYLFLFIFSIPYECDEEDRKYLGKHTFVLLDLGEPGRSVGNLNNRY